MYFVSSPEAPRSRTKQQHSAHRSSEVDSSPEHYSARHQDASSHHTSRTSPRDKDRDGHKGTECSREDQEKKSTSQDREKSPEQSKFGRSRNRSSEQKHGSPRRNSVGSSGSHEYDESEFAGKNDGSGSERRSSRDSRDMSISPILSQPVRIGTGKDASRLQSPSRSESRSPVRESPKLEVYESSRINFIGCGSIPLPKVGSPNKAFGDKRSPKRNQNSILPSKILDIHDTLKRANEPSSIRGSGSQPLLQLPQNGRHVGTSLANKSPLPHSR